MKTVKFYIFVLIKQKLNYSKVTVRQVCDADGTDEGMYTCCVTKEGVTDCAEVELEVLAVCDTENEEQYIVS